MLAKREQVNSQNDSDLVHFNNSFMNSGFVSTGRQNRHRINLFKFSNQKSKKIVIDWLSKKSREAKRKQDEEQKLRDSLSQKLADYERSQELSPDEPGDNDHTEMVLNGKKVRVSKTQIDLSEA